MLASFLQLLLLSQAATGTQDAAPAKLTVQQRFDRASTEAQAGDCAAAIADFAVIEANKAAMKNETVAAAIALRKGLCLIAQGQVADGEASVRRGLPVFAARPKEFSGDLVNAHAALGQLAMERLDYAGAIAEEEQALALASGSVRIRPLLALAQLTQFDGDGKAIAYAEEARTLTQADPAFDKTALAAVQTIYARALLNAGRNPEAYSVLKDSLRKLGGLDLKVGLSDLTTRSDLAIAALLNRDEEAARNYLAYTGAGRLEDSPFDTAVWMQPPACNPAAGINPDDFAIVEFSLETDGHVSRATPIYVKGGRAVALAFADAVMQWSWKPETTAKIPPLFRYATRLELRCVESGERPGLMTPLNSAFDDWYAAAGGPARGWADKPDALAGPLERSALAEAAARKDDVGVIGAALALGANPTASEIERRAAARQASDAAAGAPAGVRTLIAIERAHVDSDSFAGWSANLRNLLADPLTDADPIAGATVRLLLAQPAWRHRISDDGVQLLDWVIDNKALPDAHPLKVSALLAKANVMAGKGDLEAARALFDRTGLTAEQCAYVGVTPSLRHNGASSNDYPEAALMMGFGGWLRTEFNIAADGKTIAPRVIIAYPPFVFDEAATGIIKDSRYTASYRPNDEVACRARQETVRFLNHR